MDFFKFPYLIAAWVIHQLMGAGMQRLASVDGVQDHLVTYDHLERKEQQSFAKGRMGVHRLRCMVLGGHPSQDVQLLQADPRKHGLCSERWLRLDFNAQQLLFILQYFASWSRALRKGFLVFS